MVPFRKTREWMVEIIQGSSGKNCKMLQYFKCVFLKLEGACELAKVLLLMKLWGGSESQLFSHASM